MQSSRIALLKARTRSTTLNSAGKKPLSFTFKVLLFFVANAATALLVNQASFLSTIHAYLTLLVGLFFLLNDKKPLRVMCWLGYIAGIELFWRATEANIFWETGKYATIVIAALAILKFKSQFAIKKGLILYFILLVPSVFLLRYFDREAIAFALAGPFALMTAGLFFSGYEVGEKEIKSILLSTIAAVLMLSTLALAGVIDAETIEFSADSNFALSANTGPNQVSSILSLGAFAAIIYAFLEKEHKFLRFVVILLAIGLFTQVTLTYSRGGLYTLAGAVIAGGIFIMRDSRARASYLSVSIIIVLAFTYLILPSLDRWTQGTLSARIQDTEPTGRLEIIRADLEVFLENPLFGVGVGESYAYHARYFRAARSHTEYSRMLAEHGLFGLASLLILIFILAKQVFAKEESVNKAIRVASMAWGLLFMAHSATRLVSPSFLIGLSLAHFSLKGLDVDAEAKQD